MCAGAVVDNPFDSLERDHGVAGIGESLGAVLDPKYAVFEVLAVGLDLGLADVGAVAGGHPEGFS